MQICEQTASWTVLQHGQSVHEMLEQLLSHFSDDQPINGWRLPSWLASHGKLIANHCHPLRIRHGYTLYHDCGKPLCRQVDGEGKIHFPNHAQVSRETFLNASQDPDAAKIANLIGWDMAIHTSSAEEIDRYCREEWKIEDACTLLLTALSEVHSNANLFGGIETTSFKAKWKQIDRRGKQIIRLFFES